tara:strand:+ start:13814 stop:15373 length:1560 start_codon:yes stop_codon:yes gene_type:complete
VKHLATILCSLFAAWFTAASSMGASQGVSQDDDKVPKTFSELEAEMRSKFPDSRRRAVKHLVEIGTDDAWEWVLRALEDPLGQVADEAQLALPKLPDERRWKLLLGKEGLAHDDPWVRVRMAEVVGRTTQALDARKLLRALDPRDPVAARTLLRSLVQKAGGNGLTDVPRRWGNELRPCLTRRKEPWLRAEALAAWFALDPEEAGGSVLDGTRDKSGHVRAAALLCLTAQDTRGVAVDGAALREATRLIVDEDAHVRWVAVECLGRLGTKAALEVLIARLGVEPRERIERRVVERLQARSGLFHRRDPRPWRDWVRDLPPSGGPSRPAQPPENRGDSVAGTTRLPITSDRLAFLIDMSGSIWNVRDDGTRRKDEIDVIVHQTIDALPDGVRFNLVPFAGQPVLWQDDGLATASKRTRREARTWYDDLKLTGPGDFEGAVRRVLLDPEIDTLCVLTDGAPTGGRRWHLEMMMQLLLAETRFRPVTFDVVLVDASRAAERRWDVLCVGSGGELTSRTLKGR